MGPTMPGASDILAELLRRRPDKPIGSPRLDSNPTSVVFLTGGAVGLSPNARARATSTEPCVLLKLCGPDARPRGELETRVVCANALHEA